MRSDPLIVQNKPAIIAACGGMKTDSGYFKAIWGINNNVRNVVQNDILRLSVGYNKDRDVLLVEVKDTVLCERRKHD